MARAMVPLRTIRYQCSYIHVIAGTAKPAGKRGGASDMSARTRSASPGGESGGQVTNSASLTR